MTKFIQQKIDRQASSDINAIIQTEMKELRIKQVRKQGVIRHAILRKHQKQSGLLIAQLCEIKRALRGQRCDVWICQNRQRHLGL